MHPYHLYLLQKLHGSDFQNRVQFAEWFLQQVSANENFLENILFTKHHLPIIIMSVYEIYIIGHQNVNHHVYSN